MKKKNEKKITKKLKKGWGGYKELPNRVSKELQKHTCCLELQKVGFY